MSKIIKPYVADCRIGDIDYNNLEVLEINNKNVWVKLPNGDRVKRHIIKHKVDIKYISPLIGGKFERSIASR